MNGVDYICFVLVGMTVKEGNSWHDSQRADIHMIKICVCLYVPFFKV